MDQTKTITHGTIVRKKMVRGAQILARTVGVTLGPKGRNVMIDRAMLGPVITKDGVTVAKEVMLSDPLEDMGATIVRQASEKTSDDAGDGTTTATVIAGRLITEANKLVESGMSPINLHKGMLIAQRYITDQIGQTATKISSVEEIKAVATLSANGDTTIGDTVSEAMDAVGKDGVIMVEESNTVKDVLELIEGARYEKGWKDQAFGGISGTATLENPYVLIIGERVEAINAFVDTIHFILESGRPLLFIANDIALDALSTFILNHKKEQLICCCVPGPSFGQKMRDMMEDLAIFTGATLIATNKGIKPSDIKPEHLGTCDKAVINKTHTTIFGGKGSNENITARITSLRSQRDSALSLFDKDRYQERIGMLSGGIGVIKIGEMTEAALRERKARVEDAIGATRSAIKHGVVAGGGSILAKISASMGDLDDYGEHDVEECAGWNAVRTAIQEPIRLIAKNCGVNADTVYRVVSSSVDPKFGWNASTEEYGDLFIDGVIDPSAVTQNVVVNAISAVHGILTSECAIVYTQYVKDQDLSGGLHV